jgi:hypothetical protein
MDKIFVEDVLSALYAYCDTSTLARFVGTHFWAPDFVFLTRWSFFPALRVFLNANTKLINLGAIFFALELFFL